MKIEFSTKAVKQLSRMDKTAQRQIKNYLDGIVKLENPRSKGRALKGNLSGLWRYRTGDYRIICHIQDDKILITILTISHRKEAYRGNGIIK